MSEQVDLANQVGELFAMQVGGRGGEALVVVVQGKEVRQGIAWRDQAGDHDSVRFMRRRRICDRGPAHGTCVQETEPATGNRSRGWRSTLPASMCGLVVSRADFGRG